MTRITAIVALGYALLTAAFVHAQAPADTLQPGTRYVALGSSFAAGPGVPEQLGDCGRSGSNYANLGQTLEEILVSVTASQQNLIADPYVLAEGHGPYASPAAERWINGNVVASSGVRYHPTAEGHEAMARLVLTALGRE